MPDPIVISLSRLAAIDRRELMKRAAKAKVKRMTEAEAARAGFTTEEIDLIKTYVLVETEPRRRSFRLRHSLWAPPMILRGDYDGSMTVYSPRKVTFIP